MIRSGTDQGRIAIRSSITLLGPADTGSVRPLIVGSNQILTDSSGVVIRGAAGSSRVELRGLRFDTLYQAITVRYADTVVINGVDLQSPKSSIASIYVDSVGALYLKRCRLSGPSSQ